MIDCINSLEQQALPLLNDSRRLHAFLLDYLLLSIRRVHDHFNKWFERRYAAFIETGGRNLQGKELEQVDEQFSTAMQRLSTTNDEIIASARNAFAKSRSISYAAVFEMIEMSTVRLKKSTRLYYHEDVLSHHKGDLFSYTYIYYDLPLHKPELETNAPAAIEAAIRNAIDQGVVDNQNLYRAALPIFKELERAVFWFLKWMRQFSEKIMRRLIKCHPIMCGNEKFRPLFRRLTNAIDDIDWSIGRSLRFSAADDAAVLLGTQAERAIAVLTRRHAAICQMMQKAQPMVNEVIDFDFDHFWEMDSSYKEPKKMKTLKEEVGVEKKKNPLKLG